MFRLYKLTITSHSPIDGKKLDLCVTPLMPYSDGDKAIFIFRTKTYAQLYSAWHKMGKFGREYDTGMTYLSFYKCRITSKKAPFKKWLKKEWK